MKPKGKENQLSSPAETSAAPAVDATRDAMVAAIRGTLGAAVVDSLVKPSDDIWVRVSTESWRNSIQKLKDAHGFDYFCFLSAIDWLPSPFGRGEDDPSEPAPERDSTIHPGYTGGDTRMQLLVRIVNSETHLGINVKADVPNDSYTIESISSVFAGANWHEREAHEMFGIGFTGHPDLRNMYLPTDFEGFPMRKDFPLLARMVKPWPGIVDVEPLPGGDATEEESAS
jgi:NADH-quinone oxidoreductase subunit C